MAPPRRYASGLVIAGAVVVAAASAVWAAWAVDSPGPDERPGWRSWERAAATECPLLAQVLLVNGAHSARQLPLMGESTRSGPCDWSLWGLALGRVSAARFGASTRGNQQRIGYLTHQTLTAPRYSALRLRAAVEVGRSLGWENAIAETCYFRRGWRDWRLEGCRTTWLG
jgi:hypothetical protein